MLLKPMLILALVTSFGEIEIATSSVEKCASPRAVQMVADKWLASQNYFIEVKAKCISPKPLA